MKLEELLALLTDIRDSVLVGDSFEGSIEYLMPGPLGLKGDFAVRASYRIGNRDGQGGLRTVGKL